jgi:drug/metabolite transporter (DMT)-like permease
MNGLLPAFVGFLGALLFALGAGLRRPTSSAPVQLSLLAWLGVICLGFATFVYLLALVGAVVFTS